MAEQGFTVATILPRVSHMSTMMPGYYMVVMWLVCGSYMVVSSYRPITGHTLPGNNLVSTT